MNALAETRITTSLGSRHSRAAVLSAGLHLLFFAAWILAPMPKADPLGAGALTVQLLMEPPPPAPEPPKPAPSPEPTPQKPEQPKPEPAKTAPKPTPAARPAPTTKPAPAAPVETNAPAPPQPVMSSPPEATPAAAADAVAIGNPAARQAERDDYLRMIWARIMRFRPDRITLTGTTRLRFTLAADGALLNAEVAESSGSGLLDRAALNALERAAPFPLPPQSTGGELTFVIPFTFRPAR